MGRCRMAMDCSDDWAGSLVLVYQQLELLHELGMSVVQVDAVRKVVVVEFETEERRAEVAKEIKAIRGLEAFP